MNRLHKRAKFYFCAAIGSTLLTGYIVNRVGNHLITHGLGNSAAGFYLALVLLMSVVSLVLFVYAYAIGYKMVDLVTGPLHAATLLRADTTLYSATKINFFSNIEDLDTNLPLSKQIILFWAAGGPWSCFADRFQAK